MAASSLVWGRAVPVSAAAESAHKPAGAVVVELFTSEGCSSCPPADALLRRIAGARSDDGLTIIALSEHVTYWNNLGWVDPFSQPIFTDRQSEYVVKLHTDEAYTPQAVVNGRLQFVGSDSRALASALHMAAQQQSLPLDITGVDRRGNSAVVQFQKGAATAAPLELWAAITDDLDTSNVGRGENSGRTLQHAAVVRSLVRVGKVLEGDRQTVEVPLPAIVAREPGKARHLVLIAQLPGQGAILGAAAHSL